MKPRKPTDAEEPREAPGEPARAEGAPDREAPAMSSAGESGSAPAPETELEALQREARELRDKNLRLIADGRNFQQRAQREKQEAIKYAEADLARELLLVLDDLERTREAVRAGNEVTAIADGLRLMHERFLKVLKAHHIEPIEALRKPFNPDLHEALLQQPSDEHPAGTVMQEVARGYKMHERVLRPSRVTVSTGPAAAFDREQAGAAGATGADAAPVPTPAIESESEHENGIEE